MLKAVIFDFDGVILDTESVEYDWWKMIYADYGVELPFDLYLTCIGVERGTIDFYEYLGKQTGQTLLKEQIKARYKPRLREMCHELKILPGVLELMDEADQAAIKLAIASSSPHTWVDRHLDSLAIAERFSAVCCFGDVDQAKPSPKVYEHCMKMLDVKPHEVVAIEDSSNGVAAAKAAGIFCIAVPNPVTRVMDFSQADRCLDSLNQINLDTLKEMILAAKP